jgi:hypothetical protein
VEDAQVTRDTRLVNPRPGDDVADLLFTPSQRLHDASPGGIGEGLKRV